MAQDFNATSTLPENFKFSGQLQNKYLEYDLFDEVLSIPTHCIEFAYETVMHIYCGDYVGYLDWLGEEYTASGLGFMIYFLSFFKKALYFVQEALVIGRSTSPHLHHLDHILSDTLFMSTAVYNAPSYLVRFVPELTATYRDQALLLVQGAPLLKSLLEYEYVMSADSFVSGYCMLWFICVLAYATIHFYFFTDKSKNNQGAAVDAEYLAVLSLAEAEKEIGSVDDLLIPAINVIYLFGWFFGVYYYIIISRVPELVLFMYALPGIVYVVFSIPSYLAYDYGIIYGFYLRGAGSSAFLIFELGFDYIAITIFYMRLALQGIRLLIMVVTYASLHDFILYYDVRPSYYTGPGKIFSCKYNYSPAQTVLYYLFISLPTLIVYVMYELLHLYFVLTTQMTSFFAMIFWLFLFLYSFFFAAQVESHFSTRRQVRRSIQTALNG